MNKGDDANPQIRPRLVVAETEFQTTLTQEDASQTFSATPPYEALRFLVSCVMTPRKRRDQGHVLMFLDITRAHPYCAMRRNVWITLPPEDPRAGEAGVCARLQRSLYGLRDAGMNFELFTRETMSELGFGAGMWSPCVFQIEKLYVYADNEGQPATRLLVLRRLGEVHVGQERGRARGQPTRRTCL